LLASKVPKRYWGDAFNTATVIYNVCPRSGQSASPYQLFWGKRPDVSGFRVFGSVVYCLKNPNDLKKLDARSDRGRFLGYEEGTKGWKILLDDGRIVVRRHCRFDESKVIADVHDSDAWDSSDDDDDNLCHISGLQQAKEEESEAEEDDEYEAVDEPTSALSPPAKRTLPTRMRQPSKRFRDNYALMMREDGLSDDPATLAEALLRPDAEKWREAADEEMSQLKKLGVFEIVEKPPGVRPLASKWVLLRKRNADGSIERYRARWVVKGFGQRPGIDFNEIFAPVVKPETVRLLLAYAATYDLEIQQIDVRTAFMYGELHEEVYMEQPEGYDFGGGKVLKLLKSINGLKQAARCWYNTLKSKLLDAGFMVSNADTAMFIVRKESSDTHVLIYVDDGLIVGSMEDVSSVIGLLEQHFKIRRLGSVRYFLGSEILRDREKKKIILTQRRYAQQIVDAAGLSQANPRTIPLDVNSKLTKEGEDLMTDPSKFMEILGMLMYLANGTRPDISFSVGALARFMSAPRIEHYQKLMGIVRYVKGTIDKGLHFDGQKISDVVGFSDADFAGDIDKRRSTTGYVFVMAGGAISWSSRLQATVAASTTEAEYMAASAAVKEALWLRKIITEIWDVKEMKATQMFGDNQSALAIMRNPRSHQRAKHIDVQHHFIRDRVERGEVVVQHVPSKNNLVDMLTKPVARPQLLRLCDMIGLRSIS
jgi:hypothetical protein